MTSLTTIFSSVDSVRRADGLIRPYIRETPLEAAPWLHAGEGDLWLKYEHLQISGSVKARGAYHLLLALSDVERSAGLVTASSGNWGVAFAGAAERLKIDATIFFPQSIDKSRIERVLGCQTEIRFIGKDMAETEAYAREAADTSERTYVSPYETVEASIGMGTLGLEIHRQLDTIDAIVLPVGGGAALAGIAGYLKAVRPRIKVVAASSEYCASMFDTLMDSPDDSRTTHATVADSLIVPVSKDFPTVDLCRALIDQWILVGEDEIKDAMCELFDKQRLVTEGAGALTVAAYRKEAEMFADLDTVAVICGGNVGMREFRGIVGGT